MEQEKLKELLSDEAFVKELLKMEEPEQVQKALEEKGVSISLQEIRQIGEFLKKVQSGEISQEKLEAMANGELSEDELEEVAGGFAVTASLVVMAVTAVAFMITSAFTRGRW